VLLLFILLLIVFLILILILLLILMRRTLRHTSPAQAANVPVSGGIRHKHDLAGNLTETLIEQAPGDPHPITRRMVNEYNQLGQVENVIAYDGAAELARNQYFQVRRAWLFRIRDGCQRSSYLILA
jgi:hypothetical protein